MDNHLKKKCSKESNNDDDQVNVGASTSSGIRSSGNARMTRSFTDRIKGNPLAKYLKLSPKKNENDKNKDVRGKEKEKEQKTEGRALPMIGTPAMKRKPMPSGETPSHQSVLSVFTYLK